MTSSSGTNVCGSSSSATKRGSISVGTLTRAKLRASVIGSRTSTASDSRQARDVGKRAAGADGQRRQRREDLAPEALRESDAVGV